MDAPKFIRYDYEDWVMYRVVEKNGVKKNETYSEKQNRIFVQTSLIDDASLDFYAVLCSLEQQPTMVTLQPFRVLVLSIQIGEIDKDAKLNYVIASRNSTLPYTGTKLTPKNTGKESSISYSIVNLATGKEVPWMTFDNVRGYITVFTDDPANIGNYNMQLRLTAKPLFPDMKPLQVTFAFQIFS
jgi:hypothetical protein